MSCVLRNCSTTYLHGLLAVFRYAQKTPFEEIYRGACVFEVKIFDFYFKNTRVPKKNFLNAFRAQRETVRKVLKQFFRI